MGINKTEILALEWLKKQGYEEKTILRVSNKTPDFICPDGKRFEVKYLYGNNLIFYKTQTGSLKPNDIILVFDKNRFIAKFLWEERENVHFNIKIVSNYENQVNVQVDRDVADMLIKLKSVGDTYSDVIRRLLDDNR